MSPPEERSAAQVQGRGSCPRQPQVGKPEPGEIGRAPDAASVWIVTGWFGEVEWYEPYAYLHKDEAQAACDSLWETRNSENGPPHARGLHKFSVEELAVIG